MRHLTTRSKVPLSRFAAIDTVLEALSSLVRRPGRAVLTAAGTVVGVGSVIAVLGLTSTATAQIGSRFDARLATEVVVRDGRESPDPARAELFPTDADARVGRLNGVVASGVSWLPHDGQLPVKGAPVGGLDDGLDVPVVAASPGLFASAEVLITQGRAFDDFHSHRAEQVTVLGSGIAERLGVTDLAAQPAVFVDGIPFTVVGVAGDAARRPDLLLSMIVPSGTARELWGPPDPEDEPTMLVTTEIGAAVSVAGEIRSAVRPDAPALLEVVPPPDPRGLRGEVDTELTTLFLTLAVVSLLIGTLGIANTTLVAVMERVPEIGLRRALGARPRHIAGQILTESAFLGVMGGLVGASLGVVTVLSISLVRSWIPVIAPAALGLGPAVGLVVGVIAGLYPALRAAGIEPVDALRR